MPRIRRPFTPATSIEYRKRRFQMSPERRAADRIRSAVLRRKFLRYCPNPLSQADTIGMAEEELNIVLAIRDSGQTWVKLWVLLNSLAGKGPELERRPRRQAYLALLNRLLREKKLIRHRPTNTIALAPCLR